MKKYLTKVLLVLAGVVLMAFGLEAKQYMYHPLFGETIPEWFLMACYVLGAVLLAWGLIKSVEKE